MLFKPSIQIKFSCSYFLFISQVYALEGCHWALYLWLWKPRQMSFCYGKACAYNFRLWLIYSWHPLACLTHRKDATRGDSWVSLIFLTQKGCDLRLLPCHQEKQLTIRRSEPFEQRRWVEASDPSGGRESAWCGNLGPLEARKCTCSGEDWWDVRPMLETGLVQVINIGNPM